MAFIICLAGPAGPDKTALMQGLAGELGRRGREVGLIFHDQAGDPPSGPAWDSISLGPGWLRLERREKQPPALESLVGRYLEGLDLVLSEEGLDQARPKVEYCPAGTRPGLLDDPGLRALVSPEPLQAAVPVFAPQDLAGLAELLLQKAPPRREPDLARILVDGRRVPAKHFVQEIIAATIRAMVRSLKGGERPGRLEIFLD